METKNSTYLILSIILLILSVIGGYFLLQNFTAANQDTYKSSTIPKIELIPTDIIESSTSAQISLTPTTTATASALKTTPIITSTKIPTIIPTKTPTKAPTITSIPSTNNLKEYSSPTDVFSISYSASRQFTQDTETSGNRYTFSSSVGNFAVHVSPSGTWAWINTNRQFSSDFTVSGQPTFRYVSNDGTQTIVDLQSSDKNYTLQCVHNGVASVKAECEAFLSSFKLL
jgi:hypothetical protein